MDEEVRALRAMLLASALRINSLEKRLDQLENRAESLPMGYSRLQIAELIVERFSADELEVMAWDMDIEMSELTGETMSQRVRSLIDYCERRQMIHELIYHCRRHRPSVRWPNMPRG